MATLVACRTHYTLAYLAWAERAGSYNDEDFLALTNTGFVSPWDGGANYDESHNRMWHVFLEAVFDGAWASEEPVKIAVKVLYRGRVRSFELPSFGKSQFGWSQTELEKLWRAIEELWNGYPASDSEVPAEEVLKPQQVKFCQRVEKWYFPLWGQGGSRPF